MASKMLCAFGQRVTRRWLSASSMAVPLTEVPSYVTDTPGGSTNSPSVEPVQVTKLSNGVTVATRDNSSPYANIGVFVKSGSRAEEYDQQGLSHLLANTAFLSTTDKTGFTLSRQLEHIGVNFSSRNSREFVTYNAILPKGTENVVMSSFASIITSPALYHWEVRDELPRLTITRNNAFSDPSTVVSEELHKYAFRSGLSNSVFCPSFHDNKFDDDSLREFRNRWFIAQNTAIVGVGVNHQDMVELANKNFSSLPDLLPRPFQKADYVGGAEIRMDSNTDSVHAAIACKGASITGDPKDLCASMILQHILGAEQYVKWGSGSATSRLNKAAASKVDSPFQINALNINYSDTGLFGMCAVASGNTIRNVLKSALIEFAEIAKGNYSTDDLQRAKNQLKKIVSDNSVIRSNDVNNIAQQVSFTGSFNDITASTVDSITAQDVNKFAKMVFATQPTLVMRGNLCDAPRLDDLLSGVSVK